MPQIFRDEMTRLSNLIANTKEGTTEYFRYRNELKAVQEAAAKHKPAATGFNVCESCEG